MHGQQLSWLKWPIVLAAVAVLLGAAYRIHSSVLAQRKDESDAVKTRRRLENNIVKLSAKSAKEHGIVAERAKASQWLPQIPVYGRVVPNPRATVEVRTPFAGRVRQAPKHSWPALGSNVKAGQVLGCLDIRVGPHEHLDLRTKLNEAQLKEKGADEVFKVQQERLKRLESASASVTQTELDNARVQMVEARTQLGTAKSVVKIWQEALAEIDREGVRNGGLWRKMLPAPAAGEITDLAARPDMTLEAGSLIARIIDFDKPLVRLEIPGHLQGTGPPLKLDLFAVTIASGPEANLPPSSVSGMRLGLAPQVDAASQLAGYWYEVDLDSPANKGKGTGLWRPGLFVKAYLPEPRADPRKAIAVPASARLIHQGRTLVYARIEPGKYQRREVQVLGWAGDSLILAAGVRAGEHVVIKNAQILLSEEFRPEGDDD